MTKDNFIDKALSRDEETIRSMFSKEVEHYDFLNHLLSFNCDKGWRRTLADKSNYQEFGDDIQLLDLCCGTGDVALEFARRQDFTGKAIGIDFAAPMIEFADKKAQKSGVGEKVEFRQGTALDLDYPDDSFHLITIAFGLRNLVDLNKGLNEMHRVLKPGGRFLSLEFFKLESGLSKSISSWYVNGVIPLAGRIVTGRWGAYDYLSKSREKFIKASEFSTMLKESGFKGVSCAYFIFRIAALHIAEKQ